MIHKYLSFLVILVVLPFFAISQQQDTLNQFSLDFNVPQSPGLFIIGKSPTQVISGAKATPMAVNFVTGLLETGKLDPGVAIDFAPFMLFRGTFTRSKYIEGPTSINFLRAAVNSQLSIATAQSTSNNQDMVFGIGYRTTLIDTRDVVMNNKAYEIINNALGNASDFDVDDDWDIGGATISNENIIGLQEAVAKAKKSLSTETGGAFSVGYAYSANLQSGILNEDSIFNEINKAWASAVFYRKGYNIIITYNGNYSPESIPQNYLGVSLQSNGSSAISGELLYDFATSEFIGG